MLWLPLDTAPLPHPTPRDSQLPDGGATSRAPHASGAHTAMHVNEQVWAKETTELPSSYSLISLERYRVVNSLGSILSDNCSLFMILTEQNSFQNVGRSYVGL